MRHALATIVALVAVGAVGARAQAATRTVTPRVVAFEPCADVVAGEACVEHVVPGARSCVVDSRAVIRRADGSALSAACASATAEGGRVTARVRVDARCGVAAGDALGVEVAVTCARRDDAGRLFPFSTILLSDVVALADAAIYLADSVHTLKNTTDTQEDDRATEVTVWWPSCF